MVRTAIVLALLLSSGAARAEPPSHYPFHAFGSEQGLENLAIKAISQTRDGLLWVGTEDGLFHYDGGHFHRLDASSGLPASFVHALLPDDDGLWVGTGGGLAHVRGGAVDRSGWMLGLPDVRVNALAADADRSLWVATSSGLYHQVDGRFVLQQGWEAVVSAAVWVSPGGRVIAGHGRDVAVRDTSGTWRMLGEADGFGRDRIDQIVSTRDGALWIRSARFLWTCDASVTRCRDVSDQLPDVSEMGRMNVGSDGALWVSTRRGLARLHDGTWETLGPSEGLPVRSVITMFEDREGSLWIAGDQLYQLLGRRLWRNYHAASGLPGDTVWTVTRDRDQRLWIGSNRGLATPVDGQWRTIPATEPYAIQSIADAGAQLYVSGSEGNIIVVDRRSWETIALGPAPGDGVPSMLHDGTTLWVGTMSAGLWQLHVERDQPRWRRVALPDGASTEDIMDMQRDRAGRLWVAGSSGLAVLEHGRWARFGPADGLADRAIDFVLARASGEYCVAYASGRGVSCFRYRDGALATVRHHTRASGLTSDKVYLLGEDRGGRLYVGLGTGLDLLDGTSLEHFSTATGMVGDDCAARAFRADADGAVWIGTTRGLSRFASDRYTPPAPPPAPQLISVSADVREGAGALAVHFATPSYANRTRLEQQVRLSPIEREWRTTSVHEARYTRLAPGEYTFEVRARHATGAHGPVSHYAFRVPPAWWQTLWFRLLAVLAGLVAIALVIAWRAHVISRRAAAGIRERSEASFRALIEQSPDAVLVHRDGSMIYVNARTVALLGYEHAGELVGRPILDIIDPADHAAVRHRVTQVIRTGEPSTPRELAMLSVTGEKVLVEVSALRIEFDGKPSVLAIGRDCRERKALEARVMFSDRMASIGTLAAGIAHEINNPLAYVKANLSVLQEELTTATPEIRAALADALDGANRVEGIVKGVKTFSRSQDEHRAVIDVHRAIETALRMLSSELRQRCTVVRDLAPVPGVVGDEARLGQVIVNLAANAAHAMRHVDVAENVLRIATHPRPDGRVCIEVSDNGVGMAADVRRRIFEPFFTTKDIGEGTGLGLAVCHGIVTALRGEIAVDSTPGIGTTFRILLPAAESPAQALPAPAIPPPVEPPPPTGSSVLVIDDDEKLLGSVGRMLKKQHDVTMVSSAAAALELIERGAEFDLLVCDLMMPGLTGWQLHAKLVARDPAYAARMLFMTGGAFSSEAQHFLERSDIEYLEKPFAAAELHQRVRRYLPPPSAANT